LICDDDDAFASALAMLLEGERDLEVIGRARDGVEALRVLEHRRADVVTMDLEMPVMDGIEATALIRARHPETAVVLVSGSGSSEKVSAGLGAGAAMSIQKSAVTDELVPAVREVAAPPVPDEI
jgi:DNA-binding NarL/FixJ family response regulator